MSADIFLLCGTRSRALVINVTQVCEQLGVEVCRALPGLHTLTRCDTISSFAGKGKKAALDIVKSSIHRIGEHVPPLREDLRKMERFVCSLYSDVNCCIVNDTRYKLFCNNQNLQSYQLPPTHLPYRSIYNAQTTMLMFGNCTGCKNSKPRTRWSRMVVRGEALEID